jgi:hypothetical protein
MRPIFLRSVPLPSETIEDRLLVYDCAIVADQCSRGRFRRGGALVIESKATHRRKTSMLKRKSYARALNR